MSFGSRDVKRAVFVVAFLLPAIGLLGMFLYYPIEETFRLSFMRSTGLGDDVYIGLKNYTRLLADSEFRAGLWHGFEWAFWSIVIQIPLAFVIAFSLIFYRNRLTGPLRAIYYLANVLPTAIAAMLGRFVFSPNFGVLNRLGEAWHLPWLSAMDFFGDRSLAFWTVFTVATWMYTGFPIVYLMARIEQIPTEIRDAAEMDGATGWTYARHIVIPYLRYPFRILVVLAVVGSLRLFDLPYLLTTGGPGDATTTLGIILYRRGFIDWQYGKAAAIGVVIFLLSLAFTALQLSRRDAGEEPNEA